MKAELWSFTTSLTHEEFVEWVLFLREKYGVPFPFTLRLADDDSTD